MANPPIQIYIVDDEVSVATACARLVRSANMRAQTFTGVEGFLESDISDENACVIADVQMEGMSGLELPRLLAKAGRELPVIIITAHDTPQMRDLAKQAGAAAYFRKPVDDQALLDAIEWAMARKSENRL